MSISLTTSAAALQAHRAAFLQLAAKPATEDVSLAQRLGLVPAPPPRLTADEWLQVHLQSRLRQDSRGECAICLRQFKAQAQVLLSCSHTFHAQCLASFERFSRSRCCPLCRCQAYQKRCIADAEQLWQHTCAARIQAAWRGRVARRECRALRRLLPPRNPALRRRWAAEQLEESSAVLVASVEQGASDIDALFAELSATAAAAGAVYTQLSSRCAPAVGLPGGAALTGEAEAAQEGEAGAGPAALEWATSGQRDHDGGAAQQQQQGQLVAQQQQEERAEWEAVMRRWLEREDGDCPICLNPLGQLCCESPNSADGQPDRGLQGSKQQRSGNKGGSAPQARLQQQQEQTRLRGQQAQRQPAEQEQSSCGLAILSCSHAFHADCLSAFEAFAIASELGPARCPCCRSTYQRMDLA